MVARSLHNATRNGVCKGGTLLVKDDQGGKRAHPATGRLNVRGKIQVCGSGHSGVLLKHDVLPTDSCMAPQSTWLAPTWKGASALVKSVPAPRRSALPAGLERQASLEDAPQQLNLRHAASQGKQQQPRVEDSRCQSCFPAWPSGTQGCRPLSSRRMPSANLRAAVCSSTVWRHSVHARVCRSRAPAVLRTCIRPIGWPRPLIGSQLATEANFSPP